MSQYSQSSSALPKIVLTLLAGATIFVGVQYWNTHKRESEEWNENLQVWNGGTLPTQRERSRLVYNGGSIREKLEFEYKDVYYVWEGSDLPIAVQPDREKIYLVAFDRDSEFSLYRAVSATEWEDVTTKEFPRYLAIQNASFSKKVEAGKNDLDVVDAMDPADPAFRKSLTAKLWSFLESSNFNFKAEPSEEFLRQYKDKHIQFQRGPGGVIKIDKSKTGKKKT